jgi:hypothetical protein
LIDANLFEKIFHEKFVEFRDTKAYYDTAPETTARLYRRMMRQYLGFIDIHGERYLLVIFVDRRHREWYKQVTNPIPGSWDMFCNLDTGELLDMDDIKRK